jgi:phenylpropionate dioxygenase-like ring-hydroxylating dioxygenase large terminal subunit
MASASTRQVLARNVGRGGLLAWSYDHDELMELEKELVFRRNWLLVGHVNEIPRPGDFMTLDAADERALVVRGRDGEVRAFHNLCRHRGSRVVAEPSGNCGSVITLFPDMVDFYQFLPMTTRRSAVQGRYLALPDDRREMRAARYLNTRINAATGAEDVQLIKWSWEGMRSSAFDDFILSDLESGVRAYHDRLREALPVLNLPKPPPGGTIAQQNQELGGAACSVPSP